MAFSPPRKPTLGSNAAMHTLCPQGVKIDRGGMSAATAAFSKAAVQAVDVLRRGEGTASNVPVFHFGIPIGSGTRPLASTSCQRPGKASNCGRAVMPSCKLGNRLGSENAISPIAIAEATKDCDAGLEG
jgi:hypothetical protein